MIVFLYCKNDKWIFQLASFCSPRVVVSHGACESDIRISSEKMSELKLRKLLKISPYDSSVGFELIKHFTQIMLA